MKWVNLEAERSYHLLNCFPACDAKCLDGTDPDYPGLGCNIAGAGNCDARQCTGYRSYSGDTYGTCLTGKFIYVLFIFKKDVYFAKQ